MLLFCSINSTQFQSEEDKLQSSQCVPQIYSIPGEHKQLQTSIKYDILFKTALFFFAKPAKLQNHSVVKTCILKKTFLLHIILENGHSNILYANIDHNYKSHIALTEHMTTVWKMKSVNVKWSIKIKVKNILWAV